jgi:hypothetical protein
MPTLLEFAGLFILVAIALGGFAAATIWTLAILFGDRV